MAQKQDSRSGLMVLTFLGGAALGGLVVALSHPPTRHSLRGRLRDLVHRFRCGADGFQEDDEDVQAHFI